MSLLDDVSIVVTPNGYKAGELYAVVPVPTEGAEQVVNGDFATDSDWTKGTGWSIANGKATSAGSNFGGQLKQTILETNKIYLLTFDIVDYTSGVLALESSYYGETQLFSGIGSYTAYFNSSSQTELRLYSQNFNGSIDNVSVKEYTSADMDVTRATAATRVDENGLVNYAEVIGGEEDIDGNFPLPNTNWTLSGFTISDNKLHCVSDGTYNNAIQSNVFVIGRTYKITFDITGWTLGDIRVRPSGQSPFQLANANGSYTFYYTATNHQIAIERNTPCNMYLENLVVKEVTRDNVPRIDYTGGGCPHILAEPQRTNELLQSNQFDTTWIQSGTLTSGQDGVGGSTDAWKFENPNSTSSLYQSDTTSGVQTMSAYFKKNSNYGVRFYAFGSVNCSAYFDLNNGAVVSVINSTAKIETVGADWFRCSMTFDQTTSRCDFYVTNNASTQVLGNITLQYAQLEIGSYPTSYIPTSGSTVTRNQDIFTRDGIGSLINSTEGVLFVEVAALSNDGTYRLMNIRDVSNTDNFIYLGYKDASNTIRTRIEVGGVASTDMEFVLSNETEFNKIAIKWKTNDFALWVNGVEVATDSSGVSFTANTLDELSLDRNGSLEFNGKIKQLQVYDTALTDEQLLQLTGESGTDFYESYAEMASALTYTIQ